MSEENEKIKSKLEAKIRLAYSSILGNPQVESTIKWWNDFLDEALLEKDVRILAIRNSSDLRIKELEAKLEELDKYPLRVRAEKAEQERDGLQSTVSSFQNLVSEKGLEGIFQENAVLEAKLSDAKTRLSLMQKALDNISTIYCDAGCKDLAKEALSSVAVQEICKCGHNLQSHQCPGAECSQIDCGCSTFKLNPKGAVEQKEKL